jgi:hypothetical protein
MLSDRGNTVLRSDGGPREEATMSEPMPGQDDPGAQARDVADAGATDEDAGNLTVEDDPQGTHDPADLAGSGGAADDGVE